MTRQFTEEQSRVIETWDQGIAVLAGAGSGKTTTLVEKCRQLVVRNPRARLAGVSFTERSARDLERKLGLAGCLETAGGINTASTIHGLCGLIIREFPRAAGLEGGESVLSEVDARVLWNRAVEELWSETAPPEVQSALEVLWEREGRERLERLLARMRDIEVFGAVKRLREGQAGDVHAEALCIAADFALERYEKAKLRRGGMDFGDLEKRARLALSRSHVARAYQQRFDLVLGDEFQDTNLVQSEILRSIVRPDFSNLIIVGDPKQSIYRFRDADVSLFEEFAAKLPVQIELTRNFRSLPAIVDFVNASCAQPFMESGLSYVALVAGLPAPSDALPATVRLDVSAESGARQLACWIRAELAKGAEISDFVLLLRGVRSSAGSRWIKGLVQEGLPLAVSSGGFFWTDPRVAELAALLRWYEVPANQISAAIFLRAPWMGLPDALIDAWARGPNLAGERGAGLDWERLARIPESEGFTELSRAVANQLSQLRAKRGVSARPGEVIEAVLDAFKQVPTTLGAEVAAIALGLWHRLESLSSQGLSYARVMREVDRAIEDGKRESDLPPPGGDVLRVLTVHGSKGLEFKRVILADFGAKARALEAPMLFWDRARGAFLARRDAEGDRLKDDDELAWRAFENEQELAESKRLFYVALTRAQHQLVLVCPELGEKEKPSPWRQWVDAVLPSGIRPPENSHPLTVAEAQMPEPPESSQISTPLRWRMRRPRHGVTEWAGLARCPRSYLWKLRPPQQTVEAFERVPARIDWESKEEREGGDRRALGIEIHGILEAFAGGTAASLAQANAALDALATRQLWRQDRVSAFRQWARTRFEPTAVRRYPELAFEIALETPGEGAEVDPEVLVGSIDLLEVEAQEVRVVDYKVTQTARGEDLVHQYGVQLQLYAWAAHKLMGHHMGQRRLRAQIVEIANSGISTLEVPLPEVRALEERSIGLLAHARTLLSLADVTRAPAIPGKQCGACLQRSRCPDAGSSASIR